MFRQILGAVARSEIDGIKRRARVAVFWLTSVILASLAVVFGIVASFLWLTTRYEAWLAALSVAGALVAGALLVWVTGRVIAGHDPSSRSRSHVQMQSLLDDVARTMKKDETSLPAIATALAVGFAIGRRISK